MKWSDIGEKVADFAPLLGSLLGGPAGASVGALIASEYGTKSDPAEIAAKISTDPNAAINLRKIELDNKAELMRIKTESLRIEAQDRQNARAEHKDSKMPAVLSIGLTLLVAFIVYLLFYVAVPTGAKEVLFMMLGIVAREWAGSMQYWFGTTRSSADKNKLLMTKP